MTDARQLEKAWRHLWAETYGLRISRVDAGSVAITVAQLPTSPSKGEAMLYLGHVTSEQSGRLAQSGWDASVRPSGPPGVMFRRAVSQNEEPISFFTSVAAALAVVTARAASVDDLRIQLLDIGSDAGWAQAGCLFAAPGMVIGALVGAAVTTHVRLPLGELWLGLGILAGAMVAFAAGGLLAVAVLRIAGFIGPLRRFRPPLSMVGWFAGSIAVPLAVAAFVWDVMGW